MKLFIKKVIFYGIVPLFIFFVVYSFNSIEAYTQNDYSVSGVPGSPAPEDITVTNTETTTTIHYTIPTNDGYNVDVERFLDRITGDCSCNEKYIYNEPNSSSVEPTSQNTALNSSTDSHDHIQDHINDWSTDARRQAIDDNKINNNETTKTKNEYRPTNQKTIHEANLPKKTILYLNKEQNSRLDSTLILEKIRMDHELTNALDSSVIKARFQRIKYTIKKTRPARGTRRIKKAKLKTLDALTSGYIAQLIKQKQHSDLIVAQTAFNELKKLWYWKREHTFLIPNLQTNSEESNFIAVLGIDIMKIAEQNLIIRHDYIVQHADAQTFKIIQDYKEKCSQWQQKGDLETLFNEKERLQSLAIKNGKTTDLATNICLAIAENCLKNQITRILHSIVHAPSLEKARIELLNLEVQAIDQAKKSNMTLTVEMNKWIIDQYGFDILDAAQNCYQSRADYVKKPENNSLCTDPSTAIISNIENKNLPTAHAELVYLETHIDTILEEQNITDPIAQKEYMVKCFGTNVLETALKKYTNRPDHKKLVEMFVPIDVEKSIVTILENNNTYESVADEITHVADCVLTNAKHASLDFISEIEPDIYDFIDKLKITNKVDEFIVDVSIVDHLLTDIQYTTQAIVDGKPTMWKRSPDLIIRGLTTFGRRLNPYTQVVEIGHLVYDVGTLLKKGGECTVDALCDPITTTRDAATATFQLITLANAASNFVSDLTFGRLYLPAKEYKKRTDFFCEMVEQLANTIDENVTAEQTVDFVAQVAADLVFPWALIKGCRLLKQIDALGKLSKPAVAVARTFKKAVNTHLADSPVLVTAEGITVKMTDAMHNINTGGGCKNIINSAKTLLEGAYAKIAVELESEIAAIKKIYDRTKDGFAEFSHLKVTMEYEHILGMELNLNKKGKLKLSGFHHDLENAIQKSDVLKFSNKIIDRHGCYSTDLVIDGLLRIPDKTFFPAHWSRKDVIEKIYEAYDNFKKSGANATLIPNGTYKINGFTKEGIEIEILLTQKGVINTAYPKLGKLP